MLVLGVVGAPPQTREVRATGGPLCLRRVVRLTDLQQLHHPFSKEISDRRWVTTTRGLTVPSKGLGTSKTLSFGPLKHFRTWACRCPTNLVPHSTPKDLPASKLQNIETWGTCQAPKTASWFLARPQEVPAPTPEPTHNSEPLPEHPWAQNLPPKPKTSFWGALQDPQKASPQNLPLTPNHSLFGGPCKAPRFGLPGLRFRSHVGAWPRRRFLGTPKNNKYWGP